MTYYHKRHYHRHRIQFKRKWKTMASNKTVDFKNGFTPRQLEQARVIYRQFNRHGSKPEFNIAHLYKHKK